MWKKRREAKAKGKRSGFEVDFVAKVLDPNGIKYRYEEGPIGYDYPIRSARCLDCGSKKVAKRRTYLPDFRIGPIVVETKGKLDSPGRTKLIAIKASNPGLDIRIVFMKDNRIRKGSETYYSDWAKAQGFPYVVGLKMPAKWIKEFKNASKDS